MYWLPDIIIAIRKRGGQASLTSIYSEIRKGRPNLPTEWESAVRATIYQHSSDARGFVEGNPDVFKYIRRGVWALRKPDDLIFGKSESSLRSQALSDFTLADFESCRGDVNKLELLIQEKIQGIRKRFNL